MVNTHILQLDDNESITIKNNKTFVAKLYKKENIDFMQKVNILDQCDIIFKSKNLIGFSNIVIISLVVHPSHVFIRACYRECLDNKNNSTFRSLEIINKLDGLIQ